MRKLILSLAAAGAILAAGTMASSAITLAPEGLKGAIQETSTVDKAYCWINSWGRYRCTYGYRYGGYRHYGYRHYGYRHYGYRRWRRW